jgi:hypothetical protein
MRVSCRNVKAASAQPSLNTKAPLILHDQPDFTSSKDHFNKQWMCPLLADLRSDHLDMVSPDTSTTTNAAFHSPSHHRRNLAAPKVQGEWVDSFRIDK